MSFWDRPRDAWLRRVFFQVHLWCGLTLGLYFVLVCVTGTVVVYKKELERLAIPELVHVEPTGSRGSFAGMVRLVTDAYPGQRLVNAYLYQERGVSWSFRLQGSRGRVQVYVDPYRMRILGQDTYENKFLQWVYDLHTDLLMGPQGLWLNGWGAWLLVAMCMTGIVVWWPGSHLWRRGFQYASRAGWKGKTYDIHRLTGVASLALLILIAVTGAYYAFTPQYEAAIAAMTGDPARRLAPRVVSTAGVPAAELDRVLDVAMRTMPEGEARLFTFSSRPELPHSLHKALPDDWRTQGDNVVYLHPQTAEVVRVDYHRDLPLGVRLQRDMFGLHFGTFWGHPSRVVWLLLGIAPLILFVSGVLIWWNRTVSKLFRRRGAASPIAAPATARANVAATSSTVARQRL
ncbi:MAG: PepSY domain-containing protein [Acidobacteria bacterium]|nr:PepSY domain-containing protein [Acidobacteriota bacterium]